MGLGLTNNASHVFPPLVIMGNRFPVNIFTCVFLKWIMNIKREMPSRQKTPLW